jgi:nitroreductase
MEIKIPQTENPVHSFITKRWSARSFAEKPISESELNTLIEAASWAASSMNEQPWHYLIAKKGSASFQKMVDCLMAGNQPWAKNASVLLLSLARKNFASNGKPNRHAMHDVGAANTTLLLQAANMDIYGHMMGGYHHDATIEAFEIDENEFEISCFIALGYLDAPEALEEPFRTRELTARSRKAVNEISAVLP